MPAKRFDRVPGHLRRKVPPALLMLADGRMFWMIFALGFALFMIYGPVVGPPDHDGIRYLVAPLICPWVPTAYYLLRPIRPYSGYSGRWGDLAGMIGKDKTDPEAARLAALFRSAEARDYILRAALRMSAILLAPLVLTALLDRNSLTWTFPSPWLVQGFIGGLIGSWIALFADTVGWGVRTWAINPPASPPASI